MLTFKTAKDCVVFAFDSEENRAFTDDALCLFIKEQFNNRQFTPQAIRHARVKLARAGFIECVGLERNIRGCNASLWAKPQPSLTSF